MHKATHASCTQCAIPRCVPRPHSDLYYVLTFSGSVNAGLSNATNNYNNNKNKKIVQINLIISVRWPDIHIKSKNNSNFGPLLWLFHSTNSAVSHRRKSPWSDCVCLTVSYTQTAEEERKFKRLWDKNQLIQQFNWMTPSLEWSLV